MPVCGGLLSWHLWQATNISHQPSPSIWTLQQLRVKKRISYLGGCRLVSFCSLDFGIWSSLLTCALRFDFRSVCQTIWFVHHFRGTACQRKVLKLLRVCSSRNDGYWNKRASFACLLSYWTSIGALVVTCQISHISLPLGIHSGYSILVSIRLYTWPWTSKFGYCYQEFINR